MSLLLSSKPGLVRRNWHWLMLMVLVGGGFMAMAMGSQRSTAFNQEKLFPDLLPRLNEVARISIATHNQQFVLARNADSGLWQLPAHHDFPADFSKVRLAMIELAQATIIEPKTARPELFQQLDVDDITRPESKAVQIDLLAADDTPIASLLVGKPGVNYSLSNKPAYFVRRTGENQALLISAALEADPEPKNWLQQQIVDVDQERVRRVTLSPENSAAVIVGRKSPFESAFTLENLPADKVVKNDLDIDAVGSVLSLVRFEDVLPVSEIAQDDVLSRGSVETFDGLTVSWQVVRSGGQEWVLFDAAWQAAPNPETWDLQRPEGFTRNLPLREPAEVAREAKELAAFVDGWAFMLPDFKNKRLLHTLDELVKAE